MPRPPCELFVEVARERPTARMQDRASWAQSCRDRKASMWRKTNFDVMPVKPQRVYQEMNKAFGKDVRYVSTIGLSQIQAAQLLHVYKDRHWINAGQAGPLGWTVPAALGVATASPDETVVALSGDYDFQFMVEELAVGAQFNIPYIHVLVNNAYLGLIRQSQRGFDMDYCVQLSFDNINSPEVGGYGVDHVKVAEGLGCKAIRVFDPEEIYPPSRRPRPWLRSTASRSSSRSSWSGSPTSPWACRSPASPSSRSWPRTARMPRPRCSPTWTRCRP